MKLIRLFALCFTIISLSALAACSPSGEPDAPRGVAVEYETLTLRWGEVDGARIYTVRIEREGGDPVEVDVSKNNYPLNSLAAGEYKLSVKAVGKRKSDASDYSKTVDFIRDAENGLVFKLVGDGYEVSGITDASGVVVIPATYRQRSVVAIGEGAFFNAGGITEVKLPESIKRIGAFAFSGCSYLEKINLPDGLISLGESSFSGCRMLGGELSLPNGITEIPKGAFAYCSALTGVTLGEGITEIGENAFTDCSDIKYVTLPHSLKKIGGFAFAACADLESVLLPDGLAEIGEFAFSKVISLTSVTIPDSVCSVGRGAFYHCSALSEVTLGSGLAKLGSSAFLDTAVYDSSVANEIYIGNWFVGLKDVSVTAVNIREGTVGIADSALYGNKNVGAVVLPNSVEYIGDSAFAVSNIISIVMGSGVKQIANQAFLYCERLIDVALGSYNFTDQCIDESSLLSIGSYAFMNCTKLARIEIPDTVTDIGAYAFRNTEIYNGALSGAVYAGNWIVDFNKTITEELTVERGTVGIARYAFYGCTELKSIKIDGSVKVIGKGAFYNCAGLERVDFPDTLTKIEDYTFYNCSSLRLTSLPPMLREIGKSAFYKCGVTDNVDDTDSDRLEIPSGVTYIGDYAFFGCGYRRADAVDGETATCGIDIIIMGDRLEYIGKCAFRGFSSLREVTIGGVKTIGERAFYDCKSLTELTVGFGLVSVGEKSFYKCSSLLSVSLPDSLREIGDYAFYRCESLKSVRLGSGPVIIGNGAFYGNLLLSDIELGNSVVSIGEQAFRNCMSLTSLVLGDGVESIGSHAFYSCDSLTLYTAAGGNNSGWSLNWNSTFVPVVVGCEISPDGKLVSLTGGRTAVENGFSDTELSAPKMDGYVFIGWSESPDADSAEYPLDAVFGLENGKRVYPVFIFADESAS